MKAKYHIENDFQRKKMFEFVEAMEYGEFGIQVEIKDGVRTSAQNKAFHVYFRLLREALNDSGFEQVTVLNGVEIETPWTDESVKEVIWGAIMWKMFQKKHTSDLERAEVSQIYEALNRWTASSMGISIPFPDNRSRT